MLTFPDIVADHMRSNGDFVQPQTLIHLFDNDQRYNFEAVVLAKDFDNNYMYAEWQRKWTSKSKKGRNRPWIYKKFSHIVVSKSKTKTSKKAKLSTCICTISVLPGVSCTLFLLAEVDRAFRPATVPSYPS